MNGSEYSEYEEAPRRDVLEYLEIPLRYRRHVLVPFLLVMAAAIFLTMVMPRKYRSSTLILVESKNVPEYFVLPVTAAGIAQRLNPIPQVVTSRTRLVHVL